MPLTTSSVRASTWALRTRGGGRRLVSSMRKSCCSGLRMRGGVSAAFCVEAVEVERASARTGEVRAQRRDGSGLVAAGQGIENHRVLAQRDGNTRDGDA